MCEYTIYNIENGVSIPRGGAIIAEPGLGSTVNIIYVRYICICRYLYIYLYVYIYI